MQGLDALAAASDAATQADRNEQQRLQRNDYNGELTPQQSIAVNQMNGHHSVPSPTASTYTGAPIAVQHQVESNKSLPAYAPVQVQWGQANHMFGAPNSAATSAAAAAMFQAALAQNPVMAKTGGAETYNAMQHLAYYQFIQSQAVAQIAQMGSPQNFFDQNAALAFAGQQAVSQLQAPSPSMMAAHPSHAQHINALGATMSNLQQVIPGPSPVTASSKALPTGNMLPPPPPSQVPPIPSISSSQQLPIAPNKPVLASPTQTNIALRPVSSCNADNSGSDDDISPYGEGHGDKKHLKRAANRRSAQLSRKRKKQFIEELKEENDELRRKEAILRSIPDLIVVFDSAGKLWFVSHSVNRFLDFSPSELQGSSFWERLCPESVRLLKAAFMDALAARKPDMDTAALGAGVWELRLVDKDGSHKVITLNGVVHFSGETPECVCSIRPRDELSEGGGAAAPLVAALSDSTTVSLSESSHVVASVSASSGSGHHHGRKQSTVFTDIKPGQSVISTSCGSESSVRIVQGKHGANDAPDADRQAVRISDADSGSVVSESGSDE